MYIKKKKKEKKKTFRESVFS